MDETPLKDPAPAADLESGVADDDRIDLRVWLRLLTCTNLIEQKVRRNLRTEFDTTLPRFDVLAQIARSPEGQPMRELSRRLMVSNGNITPLIDRLVEEGLVERNPSPDDRRVQHVKLTRAGKVALDKMIPRHKHWVSAMMGDLSRGQAEELYTVLGDLKASILSDEEDGR
jgi:DNA-binding MarR family transcriptional regulator